MAPSVTAEVESRSGGGIGERTAEDVGVAEGGRTVRSRRCRYSAQSLNHPGFEGESESCHQAAAVASAWRWWLAALTAADRGPDRLVRVAPAKDEAAPGRATWSRPTSMPGRRRTGQTLRRRPRCGVRGGSGRSGADRRRSAYKQAQRCLGARRCGS